jgi:hypothetical protein
MGNSPWSQTETTALFNMSPPVRGLYKHGDKKMPHYLFSAKFMYFINKKKLQKREA